MDKPFNHTSRSIALQEKASNPERTLDFPPVWQVHHKETPETEPIALRRVRRAQA